MLSVQYFKYYVLSTVRNPPAFFFSMMFPAILMIISIHQWGADQASQLSGFLVFLNYSVQTISFMLLGMGVSQEKNSPWAAYLRALPASPWDMVLGRVMHTLGLCLLNMFFICSIAIFLFNFRFVPSDLCYYIFVALLGAIPFSILGLTIGYAAHPDSARSIFTLVNILLLFGAFSFPDAGLFSVLRHGVITFQLLNLSLYRHDHTISAFGSIMCLGTYAILALYFFGRVYRRQSAV